MIETALLVYLLLVWSESLIVHETLDDRDFSNFVRVTSFIFDLRSMRGVHKIIVVDIILFRPYRSVTIVIVRHGSTRAVQLDIQILYIICAYHGTSIQYSYTEHIFDTYTIVYLGRLQTIVYTYIYNITHYRTFEQHTTYAFINYCCETRRVFLPSRIVT